MHNVSLLAAVLLMASSVAAHASGCRAHTGPVMSCADGTVYDAETKTCLPLTTS